MQQYYIKCIGLTKELYMKCFVSLSLHSADKLQNTSSTKQKTPVFLVPDISLFTV